jgi:hypothetical protein
MSPLRGCPLQSQSQCSRIGLRKLRRPAAFTVAFRTSEDRKQLTTGASSTAQFPSKILLIDDKHIDTPARQFGQKLRTAHARRLGGAFHREHALLVPWIDAAIRISRGTSCGALRRTAKRLSGSMICTLVTSLLLFRYRTAYRCRQVHQLPRSNELASLGPRASRARSGGS